MMGIMIDDFELLLKKNDAILEDVINDITKIQSNCLKAASNLNSNDLNFLTDKFCIEINQLSNSMNKLNAYQTTLKSVCTSYKLQYEQSIIDSKKLIS